LIWLAAFLLLSPLTRSLSLLTMSGVGCSTAHNFGGFEEIYNIPMIVSGAAAGVAVGCWTNARVGLHDLFPTILELCGVAPPAAVADSRSFLPLLRSPETEASKFTRGYAEYFGTRFPLCQRIAWDGDLKLVFNGFDCALALLSIAFSFVGSVLRMRQPHL
jgi:hypothetical protein